jgi:Phosphotransferase enzyme family
MISEFERRVRAVNLAVLAPLVRRALSTDEVEVLDASCQPVGGGFSEAFGIYHFEGQARTPNGLVPWSLMLKALGATSTASQEPASLDYWKRESLVYQSGLLDNLPGGLAAPRCFGVVEQAEDEVWIWLEAIGDEEPIWSLDRYGLAARHFGHFNGAYLVGRSVPHDAWLARESHRQRLALAEPGIRDLRRLLSHPVLASVLPEDTSERVLGLWGEREQLLTMLERLPRTVCHGDAVRQNLLSRGGPDAGKQTVAIDWARAGIDAIGAEIATLFGVSPRFFAVENAQIAELEAIIFTGYLEGLRDTGWQGDASLARFGYTAIAALDCAVSHLGFSLPRVVQRAEQALQHGEQQPRLLGPERTQFTALVGHLLDMGDEALTLMDSFS